MKRTILYVLGGLLALFGLAAALTFTLVPLSRLSPQIWMARGMLGGAPSFLEGGDYELADEYARRAVEVYVEKSATQTREYGVALATVAAVSLRRSNIVDAIAFGEKAIASLDHVSDSQPTDKAGARSTLSMALSATGQYARAEALGNEALAIMESSSQPSEQILGATLVALSEIARNKSEFDRANLLGSRAVALFEASGSALLPHALNARATTLQAQGKFADAEPLARRAMAVRTEAADAEDPETAVIAANLGLILHELGRNDEAERMLRESVVTLEKTSGKVHPGLVYGLVNLSRILVARGAHDDADGKLKRALAISERAFGPDHPSTGLVLVNIGELARQRFDYPSAEAAGERALHIFEKDQHRLFERAMVLNNLGLIRQSVADYARADGYFRSATEILTPLFGDSHPLLGVVLLNQSHVFADVGDLNSAEATVRRALAISETTRGPEHPDVGRALSLLSVFLDDNDKTDEAVEACKRSLAIREKALGPNHLDVAHSLNNLGNLYKAQKRYDDAEAALRRAVSIVERATSAEDPLLATELSNLALVLERKGDDAAAEALLLRAAALLDKPESPTALQSGAVRGNLAALYGRQGRIEPALQQLQRELQIEEVLLTTAFPSLLDREKESYAEKLSSSVDFAVALHRRAGPEYAAARSLALSTLLRRKGRALEVSASAARQLQNHPEAQAEVDALRGARAQLAGATLVGASSTGPGAFPEKERRLLEERVETLERKLSERVASSLSSPIDISIENIASKLRPGQALIELVRHFDYPWSVDEGVYGKWRYAAYVLHSDATIGYRDLGFAKAIDEDVNLLRTLLGKGDANSRAAARKVDAKVMQPVRELLVGVNEIYISPDGPLNLLPFAALVDESQHFLVERFQITYLTSGRDLLRQSRVQSPRGPALALVAPDYEASATEPLPVAVVEQVAQRQAELTHDFKALTGTLREGTELARTVRDLKVLQGASASEPALMEAHGPRLLHIATHGFFLDESEAPAQGTQARMAKSPQPLLRAGLALAGANRARRGEAVDGIVTALEMAGLDLWGTKLVTLSACETGLGKVHNGDGVYGMHRALVLAGAEASLLSLWKIADQETVGLMREYYAALEAGAGRSFALRRTQLARIKRGQSPYYWAPFIMSGDPRPLSISGDASELSAARVSNEAGKLPSNDPPRRAP